MPKSRIDIIASTETFENLATFESVAELNEAIRHYKRVFADELTRTDIAVLELLQRYSCRYFGVSFLRKNKIGEIIGKSRRTIIRVCNKLAQLGIVRQYEMKRKTDMQQTSNAIVIQPVISEPVSQDPPKDTGAVSPIKQPQVLKQNIVINNTYADAPLSPYVRFKTLVESYVDDRKLTNKLYGIYLAHTSFLRNAFDCIDLLNTGLQAIKSTFQASKRKTLRNIAGYFNGTLDRMLDRLYFETLFVP
ncbi:helix-turn-helix domain-containing protein [Heyndrickxia oleronia]|uniref:helix-turn-helix domain-containing protein n=1 Tax=Heyndrickxia oleronia TaxID=38875 RepID=UPI001C0ECAD5|nr:helix-turn-helix domain-containing protein [Heyndrickxia oleronia]MBU5211043.1 helix-turn-helix domain-containing protein [Heyndrickxia oleronia]